jgi:hypothetical protein
MTTDNTQPGVTDEERQALDAIQDALCDLDECITDHQLLPAVRKILQPTTPSLLTPWPTINGGDEAFHIFWKTHGELQYVGNWPDLNQATVVEAFRGERRKEHV